MRANGINGLPDPVFSGHNGVWLILPAGMDPNATAFWRARVICQKLIPAGLPYGG